MTPEQFIARWKNNPLSERAGAQAHFDDLCELLGVEKPRDPDNYCFERGAKKASGGDGWADVWKRGFFGWENKKPGRDLKAALKQLTDYALELENPPLLVVSDRERIVIHTAFTGYPDEPRLILLDDIGTPENLQTLRWVFTDPERLRPVKSLAAITEEAAGRFGALAEALRLRGEAPGRVAHFLTQCLFCMFAEDEFLLPSGMFTRLLEKADDPARATNRIAVLFSAMQSGGDYGDDVIPWFNGGLFATVDVPALTTADLAELREAARMDWRAIDPSIFGTLFERGLNPKKRAQLGAHYTDPGTIMKLIEPVIQRPLLAEWAARRDAIAAKLAKSKKQGDKAYRDADGEFHAFLERLKGYRVLDAACGSGNFLYLALKTLKDIERRVNTEAEQLGLHRQVSIEVSPANVLGIELDPYAAELARVTVWIGEIQWMLQNGYAVADRPILKPLDTIENRDALVNADGTEAEWPACDAVVGNPPFVGNKKMRGELGDAYVDSLRAAYAGSLPGGADLVTYWFEKARAQIEGGQCQCAGLVATQAIRKGANRAVLDRITASTRIFDAWSDEAWVNEGAAVRVSLVAFGHADDAQLDGESVAGIQADLSPAAGFDLTCAKPLPDNAACAYQGPVKVGSFDIPGTLARKWLTAPNPNGRPSSEVLRPWANGQDLAGRPSDTWIVDFGVGMSEVDASMYETPFMQVLQHVRPARMAQRDKSRKEKWWLHGRTGADIRAGMGKISRYIATPRVAKHRFFVWLSVAVLPDSRLYAICRDDDCTFGVLSSRFHQVWALANASRHGDGDEGGRPTYNARDCFETFPFPAGLTPRDTAQPANPGSPPCLAGNIVAENIAAAARRLNELREAWLNPPEWVDWAITPEEEAAGFPKRPVAKAGHEADLKKRTLTNLYNARPAWLDGAHKALDAAVATAYGWADYTPEMADEEILRRLLTLNLERAREH
ncbi:MAG: class I SAM-dependent DNA methyltransferase [Betaproteobacteria bacterium]|nr:class I SAM-dependent DNA methyltransferase [Betaproteobacteria bacterium]